MKYPRFDRGIFIMPAAVVRRRAPARGVFCFLREKEIFFLYMRYNNRGLLKYSGFCDIIHLFMTEDET